MSKIIATGNLKTENWEIKFEDLAPTHADLFIGFINDDTVVKFKDLRFKYELKQDANIKQYNVYPQPGVKYIKSDQKHIVVERLELDIEKEYELYLWAENDGKSFEMVFTFKTPRIKKPYNSWILNGEIWQPPVPYPDDENTYVWDEETLNWVID